MTFEDVSGGRWKRVRVVVFTLAALAVLFVVAVIVGLFVPPSLPGIATPAGGGSVTVDEVAGQASGPQTLPPPRTAGPAEPNRVPAFPNKALLKTAFLVQSDPRSVADLRANVHKVDAVFPDWYSFVTSDGELDESISPEVVSILAQQDPGHRVLVLPRLANSDKAGNWYKTEVSELIRDEKATGQFTDTLVERLELAHADGVNIDIEQVDPDDKDAYVQWLDLLAQALHRHHLLVTVDVPLNDEDAFDYEAIGQIADATVVMAYDQHFAESEPGPVADQSWFDDGLAVVVQRIPPQKILVGIGAYGYDWTIGSKEPAPDLSYADAVALARHKGAVIRSDKTVGNPGFAYVAEDGARHQVWFLDGLSAWNQCLSSAGAKVRGVSLWRMGEEDPSIWNFLARERLDDFDPASLSVTRLDRSIAFAGDGEMLRVTHLAEEGRREIRLAGRVIESAEYRAPPSDYEVERRGGGSPRQIALTFDDGPDPRWTPPLLDVLDRHGVKATFFFIGDHVQHDPDLARRVVERGHLIGNHTFDHRDIHTISSVRLKLELNSTQRAIEWATGRQTVLFRPPYDVDTEPKTIDQLIPLYTATGLGYVTVGADIDPVDWSKPGVDAIVNRVVAGIRESGSSVVLLHDGGGDRGQTVEAVNRLIPLLRQQGYEFVTVDRLMGVPMRSLMPAAPAVERAIAQTNGVVVWLRSSGWTLLVSVFAVSTLISMLRIVALGTLVLRARPRHKAYSKGRFAPPVRVVVPAYNECKVIRRTLDSVLESDYPELYVTVVDDGSTDGTAEVVSEIAAGDPRVTLLTRPNGGKASALNFGFERATEEYVVTIDADTIVLPTTVRNLMTPFADPKVDAVCGNVQVGNVNNVLTAFQDVEYVTSQNYDRRAFDSLNCISVVPGATGAWRRQSVLDVGGYSGQTLTEDADLTLAILRSGGKIVYSPGARSITEAPQTCRALFKQRFRWSFGTLQCFWKHRRAIGRGSLGWAALPNMLLFQLLFPLLSPVGDAVLLISLFKHDFAAVAIGYGLFLMMDVVGSGVAYRLDDRSPRGLWVVLIQRFFYRQFLYAVTFAAVTAALRGRRHGWNKLQRTGTVQGFAHRPETPVLRPAAAVEPSESASELLSA